VRDKRKEVSWGQRKRKEEKKETASGQGEEGKQPGPDEVGKQLLVW
jgi:hypothetical protein